MTLPPIPPAVPSPPPPPGDAAAQLGYRYSPSTGGFYVSGLHTTIPQDAVPLSAAAHAALMEAQAAGGRIVAGAGGVPEIEMPPPSPPWKPTVVTRRQARLALHAAGLLDDVETAVAGGPAELRITWQDATEWHRDDPYLAAIATALGLNAAAIDALFVQAAAL